MKIGIYQIDWQMDLHNVMFMSHDYMTKATGSDKIDGDIYDLIWEGEVDCEDLDDVYRMFNINKPENFKGRSMSVSDVIEVYDPDGGSRFWYVDSIGFKEVDLK